MTHWHQPTDPPDADTLVIARLDSDEEPIAIAEWDGEFWFIPQHSGSGYSVTGWLHLHEAAEILDAGWSRIRETATEPPPYTKDAYAEDYVMAWFPDDARWAMTDASAVAHAPKIYTHWHELAPNPTEKKGPRT